MNTTKDTLTETYIDVENLVKSIAWDIALLYGNDYENLVCEANLLYIKAMEKYDPKQSKLTTYLTHYINKSLRVMLSRTKPILCISSLLTENETNKI